MKLRRFMTLALAVAFVLVAPITVMADETNEPRGWQKGDGGWWYETIDENGELTYYADGIYEIDDVNTEDVVERFYFDEAGWMKTGWIRYTDEWSSETYWIYADTRGVIQTGWEKIDGVWYYFDEYNGRMYADDFYWIEDEATGEYEKYYFNASGKLQTGWFKYTEEWTYEDENGEIVECSKTDWFYANTLGVVQTGWQKIDGAWYYFDGAGAMYADEMAYFWDDATETPKMYYFDASGKMKTGWIRHEEKYSYENGDGELVEWTEVYWYYATGDGLIQTEWQKIGGVWYYFDKYSGRMYADGTYEIGDAEEGNPRYYFEPSGKLVTGWYLVDDEWQDYWIYADGSGKLQTGWTKISGAWHYFDTYSGRMYTEGTYQIGEDENSPRYHFDVDGKMTTGWHYHEFSSKYGGWIYSNGSGVVQTGWQKINGSWYVFNEDNNGIMVSGGSWYDDDDLYDDEGNYVGWDNVTVYYFRPDGSMITGWYNYAPYNTYGNWVYCNGDGSAYDGWLKSGSVWYYFSEGRMYKDQTLYESKDIIGADGEWTTETKRYYFGYDGKMITGWYNASYASANYSYNEWMYANPDGTLEAQWVKSGSDWYFVNDYGVIRTDGALYCVTEDEKSPHPADYDSYDEYYDAVEAWDDAHYFVFDERGRLVTNAWYASTTTYGTTWYYADANGNGYNGWLQDNGLWYYFINGRMQRNTFVEGGAFVNADGVWEQ